MKRGHKFPGLWINFESGEGAGKGTQQKLLADYLERERERELCLFFGQRARNNSCW